MSLASVEGLIVALLFIVPGALGIGLRNYLWAGKQLTSFDQLLLSLAYSTGALLLLEIATGLVGLLPKVDWRLGSYLTSALVDPEFVDNFATDLSLWYRFLLFAAVAIGVPSGLRLLRTSKFVLRWKPARHLSVNSVGFEALFEETRFEASGWDERWRWHPNESPWTYVDTTDGHRFMGQMVWRSTAPDPPELILFDVSDVTHPGAEEQIPGLLLIGAEHTARLWIMRPDNVPGREPPPADQPLDTKKKWRRKDKS